MESLLVTRLYENEVLIITSAVDEDDEQGALDKMVVVGLPRPGCYGQCAMGELAAVGPGSTAQSLNSALSSSTSSFLCCHQYSFLTTRKESIPNCTFFPFEIPIAKRQKRHTSF